MALSGIEVDDEVVRKFEQIKSKSLYKYVIFRISDDKKLVIHEEAKDADASLKGDKCKSCWNELLESLDEEKPRYILYDLHNEYKDGRECKKLVFIAWCSDNCKIGLKMLHASTKDALKKKLDGVMCMIQASDKGDLDYDEELLKQAQKGK